MPGQTFTHQSVTPASPDSAWQALQNPDTWGRIGGVSRIENPVFDLDGQLAGYAFVVEVAGTPYRGQAVRSASSPPHRMTMSIASEQLKGDITVEIHPVPTGSEVTVRMAMEPAGLFSLLLFPVVATAVAKGFPAAVERFAADLAS